MAQVQYAPTSLEDNNSYFGTPRRHNSEPNLLDASIYDPRQTLSSSRFERRASPPSSVSTSPPPTDSSCTSENSDISADYEADCTEEEHDGHYFPKYQSHDTYEELENDNDTTMHIEHIEDAHAPYTHPEPDSMPSPHVPRSEPSEMGNANDDIVISAEPSRHVDYLSHDWKEEDIWASWKYMITKRKVYGNAARLENASWRTWAKAKNKLKTVSPEKLNWLKDCDVTWLYGPLSTGPDINTLINININSSISPTSPSEARMPHPTDFIHNQKKTILKKRSMSEVLLQRSLSTSSLLKQAAASIQAQQAQHHRVLPRPSLQSRAVSDFGSYPLTYGIPTKDHTSTNPSTMESGIQSPASNRKHIHFNNRVEMCIAVDIKEEDEPMTGDGDVDNDDDEDEDSDDEGGLFLTMKPRSKHGKQSSSRGSFSETQTIARLPATTLKAVVESSELKSTTSSGNLASFFMGNGSGTTSVATPATGGSSFLMNDQEEDDDELDIGWKPAFANRRDSISVTQSRFGEFGLDDDLGGFNECPPTPPSGNEGIFGRAVDAVNTARDIAHVFWNVGWAGRK